MGITLNAAARKAVLRLTDGGNPVRIRDHWPELRQYAKEAGFTDWETADQKSRESDTSNRFHRACLQAAHNLHNQGILERPAHGLYKAHSGDKAVYIMKSTGTSFRLSKRLGHNQEKVIANFGMSTEANVIREATVKMIKDSGLGRVFYA